jgi:uncharacterized protein involved in exopolysaccharide biosynthesis
MKNAESAQVAAEPAIDAASIWQVIWRYKLYIAGVALLGALIAVGLALTATPMYLAEATVTEAHDAMLGRPGSVSTPLSGLASLAGVDLSGGSGAGRDAKAILESRHLVEEYVRRNNLAPVLFAGSKQSPTLWKAAKYFQEHVLSLHDDPRKGKTVVAIEWQDPVTAARWANGIVQLANEITRARAIEYSKRNVDYLNGQIAQTNVVELQKVMYNIIESETKTLMLANAQPEYAFAIVDPAVAPEERFKPKRTLMVAIGLIAGLLLGILTALAHSVVRAERSDDGRSA